MKNPIETQIEKVPSHAIELISRAEIDVQIATAKRYPRHLADVKQEIVELATMDEETAQACFYSLPRGSKTISGPSVRLAEIAVQAFGNVRVGTRIIDVITDSKPHVLVQAVCTDLQRNNAITSEVRRRITGKKVKGGVIDEDDINLAAAAASAIAFRNVVIKVIGQALIKPAYDAARKVAIGDARSLNDRRAACLDAFAKMGVSTERVIASVGRQVEDIGLEELGTLLGVFNAIKEGATTVDDAFPPVVVEKKKVAEKPVFDPKADPLRAEDEAKAPAHSETPEEEADRVQNEQDAAWFAENTKA